MKQIKEENFSFSNTKILKELKKLSNVRNFSMKLFKRISSYYSLHKDINLYLFLEIFSKYGKDVKNVYGKFSLKELFNFFDEDNSGYLNEDELLLIFSIIKSKLCHLDSELICVGFYKESLWIKNEIKFLTELIYEFQNILRRSLYKYQKKEMNKIKSKTII